MMCHIFDNYAGFTDQTAMILRGLEADSIINECKKRDISTSELHKLNKQDFVTLGASENLAERLCQELKIKAKDVDTSLQTRMKTNLEILNHNQQQLRWIQAYLTYCRLRLTKDKINFIVDADRGISASDTLKIAANEALFHMQDIEKALQSLKSLTPEETVRQKWHYISTFTAIIGIAALCTILYKCKS